MNIIIVGCGEIGTALAAELVQDANNISVVDLSAKKVNDLTAKLDVLGIVGNGATFTTLKEAGIDKADLLIAVTGSDELNILCCMIAKRHRRCKVIARVQNPVYNAESEYLKNELELAMVINPDYAAAEEIARVLRFPAATQIESFSNGRVELLKFRISENSSLIGSSVKSITATHKCDILFCTAERDGEAHIINGNFIFLERDVISIIATPKNASAFFKKTGCELHSIKNAIILGANDITHYLCNILKKQPISVKVIDNDAAACESFAKRHDDITVIHGDETDRALLLEEGIESADAMVTLTDTDEENIMLSLSAQKTGVKKTITKIDNSEYDEIIEKLELDSVIHPKLITSDIIVRFVRSMKKTVGSNMETMYTLIKGEVEATEFLVGERTPVINTPIAELAKKLKDDVLISAILRGKSVIIPHGHDVILPGDSVVVVTKHLGLNNISDILR